MMGIKGIRGYGWEMGWVVNDLSFIIVMTSSVVLVLSLCLFCLIAHRSKMIANFFKMTWKVKDIFLHINCILMIFFTHCKAKQSANKRWGNKEEGDNGLKKKRSSQ